MKKFQLAAAAAVMATASMAVYSAAPAFAQDTAPAGRAWSADANKTMTWADAKAKADQMWTRLDVNKDGKIDQADRAAKAAERFDKLDTDNNGALSQQEYAARQGKWKDRKAGASAPADGQRKPGGKRGHGMMGGGMHMMAMADANKDGTITRAEFDTAARAHFDMADANKDGSVTADERRAAMKSMMGKMRGTGGPGAMGDGPPPPRPAN